MRKDSDFLPNGGISKTILGYPILKEFGLSVDCINDALLDNQGIQMLYQTVWKESRPAEEKKLLVERSKVHAILTRDILGYRGGKKDVNLLFPLERSVVVGPYQSRS